MGTINLDPVEDFLEARHLSVLIERWLLSLDVADATRACYSARIAHFVRWWEMVGPTVEWRLTKSLLKTFEVHLRSVITERFNRPMGYHARHSIVRALRAVFKWAVETEKTDKYYGIWVPWPVGDPPKRKAAKPEQLARLMLAAAESKRPLRDQAILAFFIGTGCRRGEVAGLSVEDLTIMADGSGTAMVVGKSTSANPTGQRAVAFPASTGRWLSSYMDEFNIVSGPLWLNDRGDRLQGQAIYLMVTSTIERAGLTDHIRGCHDLRRAFATILSRIHPDSPAWADMIRRQLGHKHYKMTAHYILTDADDFREQIITPLDL